MGSPTAIASSSTIGKPSIRDVNANTEALASSIDAEVGNVPIEDAAGLLDCDPEATSCIEAVSKSVKAKRIVFGSVSADADGAIKVTLTRFDPGPDRQQRTFELTSTTADALADELVHAAAPLFGGEESDPVRPDPVAPREDRPRQVDGPRGEITPLTYGLLGGGGLVAGLGVVFLVQASGIADDVRAAPRNTPQDFQNLTALEDKGQTRQRLGIAFTAFGGVAIAYGIYRALSERKPRPAPEATSLRLTPVPLEGGGALVLTIGGAP